MMRELWQDLRYALRQVKNNPGFTAAAVLTLALGIGSNTAVFSLVNGVLLRPLAYTDAGRLYTLLEQRPPDDARLASYPTFQDWHAQIDAFDKLAYVRGLTMIFRSPDGPEQILAGYVSDDFLAAAGGRPILGRGFQPEEYRAGASPVAVISHRLWQRRFGGDPAALGQQITLGDAGYTIVGVMPAGFAYPEWATLWIPLPGLPANDKPVLTQRGNHTDSRVIGRLRAGVSLEAAQTQVDAVAARLAAAYPAENEGWTRIQLIPLREQVLGDAKPRLLVLSAAVAFVLLIGCSNLINLWLARATARSGEFAIRVALGAGRRRLMRQLLSENLLLAVIGGALGWLLAEAALAAVKASAPEVLPRLEEVTVDGRVLALTVALTLATGLVVGLLPALRATPPDLTASLKEGAPGSGSGTRKMQLRSALVVTQIALALVLLIGAGLLIRSFLRLQAVEPGFEVGRLATIRIMPPSPRYDDPERVVALYRRLGETLRGVPGVESVALTNHVPISGASMPVNVQIPDRSPAGGLGEAALFRTVSPEYFSTMGIPVLRGRPFNDGDMTPFSPNVLVNETFARRYWPGENVLGKQLTVPKSVQARPDFGQPVAGTVVGVVGDVRHYGLEVDLEPEVYLPYTVNPPRWMGLVIRTRSEPELTIPALRRAVRSIDPDLPVTGADMWAGFVTMDQQLARDVAPRKFNMSLLGAFAVAALLLGVIGLYGVMSYVMAQRRREIAVRMAVGAQQADVVRLALGGAMRLTLIGIGIGTIGALLLTRLMSSLLFGVAPTDPLTFVAVIALLAAVSLLASYLPALRAARTDPIAALRSE
jgi:putative ABC transport system permease protein